MALTDNQLRQLEELELKESGQSPIEVYGRSPSTFQTDNFEPVPESRFELERQIPIQKEPSRVTGILENPEALEEPNMLQRGLGAVAEDFEKSTVGAFARGANDVILALPDTAINAIGKALNYLGVTEDEWDKDYLSRIFNSSDYESQKVIIPYVFNMGVGDFVGQGESEGAIDKYARIGGQGVGMALPFIGASGRAAQTTTSAVSRIADRTGAKFSPFKGGRMKYTKDGVPVRKSTDPYRASDLVDDLGYQMLTTARGAPATAAAIEAGAGAVSTMGMQGELDIFGTQTGLGGLLPLAAIPGFALYTGTKFVGSKLPSIKGVQKISDFRAGKKIGEGTLTAEEIAATKTGRKQKGEIASSIQERLETPEAQRNLARTEEIEEGVGLDLTPAEASLDPTLVSTQKRLFEEAAEASRPADLEFIDAQTSRIAENAEKIKRFQQNIIEDPLEDAPSIIIDSVTGTRNSLIKRIKSEEKQITDSINNLANPETGALPKQPERSTTGKALRSALEDGLARAKEESARLAKKLRINEQDNIGSLSAVEEAKDSLARTVLAKRSFVDPKKGLAGGLNLGAGDRTIDRFVLDFIQGPTERLSFQNYKRLLDKTGDLLGKAIANNSKTSIKDLAAMRETLLKMGDNYGKLNKNFATFQETYKESVILPYQTDAVLKVLNKQKIGQYILPDERVALAFAENSTDANNFMKYFGENGTMLSNMESAVLDEVRRRAWSEGNGVLNVDAISNYLNTNRETLQALRNAEGESLFDSLSNTSNLLGKLLNRQKVLSNRKKAVHANLLMKKIANAEKIGDPESIIDEAIKTPSILKKIKQIASRGEESEGTLQAFRATVMQRLMAQSPDVITDPGKFKDFLDRRASVLKEAFEPEHILNLYIAADAAERATIAVPKAGEVGRANDALTALSKKLGTSLPSMSSIGRSVAESRMSGQHAIAMISTRALKSFNNAKQQALLREAIFNPKLAELITTEIPVGATSLPSGLNKKINAYLFNTGDTYGDNPVEYYYPDRPLATFPETEQEFQLDSETNEVIETAPVSPAPPAPPPPSMDLGQIAPPPPIAPTGGSQIDVASLFPFDPTSAAIQKRQQQQQGLGSLMT